MKPDIFDDAFQEVQAKFDAQVFAAIGEHPPLMIGTTAVETGALMPTLTIDRWREMTGRTRRDEVILFPREIRGSFKAALTPEGSVWAAGLLFTVVDPLPIYSQARAHRRRRVNKKWLKRYGMKITGWDYFLGDRVVVDQKHGRYYCHRHVAERIQRELAKPRFACKNCNMLVATPLEGEGASFLSMPVVRDGPADGEYTCDRCGAVNLVARDITGGVSVILLSVPGQQQGEQR